MLSKHKIYKLILSFIIMVFMIGVTFAPNIEASSNTYKVYNLTKSGSNINLGSVKSTTTNFETAKAKMKTYKNGVITSSNGLSPLKIVAATRGQAQSFPYRQGKRKAAEILKIYTTKTLSSDCTYIPAHYMMHVYDCFEAGGQIVAHVEIQGGKGYVDVTKIDIIPLIYIENGIKIKLGGNAKIRPSSNAVYSMVPHQEEYHVTKSGGVNEITVKLKRPYPGLSQVNLTYGIAPDYLKTGKIYYSPDGIRFFSDRDLKNRVGKENYYSYFQWLPLRSATKHKPEAFERLLRHYGKNNSVMMGQTHHFIEQGSKYGMNPVLIFQQANLESAYGTSKYAKDRNNVFGWGAVDSNPDNAHKYNNIGQGIAVHMNKQIAGYTDTGDWRHYGTSFGNKSAGITVKYASDPYYGIKVASLCYTMDKLNSYKDYNDYNLSLLEEGKQYSVKRASNNKEWYKTRSGLKNQVIINLGRKDKNIKTIPWMTNSNGLLNVASDFASIVDTNSKIMDIDSQGAIENTNPPSQEIEYGKLVKATTTSNLNLRTSYNTTSGIILTIPKGTKLVAELTNVGWARTTYKGKTGYVSAEYLKIEKEESGSGGNYKKGDINGDGEIDGFDMMEIKRHYLKIKILKGDQLKAADINNDGVVDGFDMMEVKRHYLGIKKIKG